MRPVVAESENRSMFVEQQSTTANKGISKREYVNIALVEIRLMTRIDQLWRSWCQRTGWWLSWVLHDSVFINLVLLTLPHSSLIMSTFPYHGILNISKSFACPSKRIAMHVLGIKAGPKEEFCSSYPFPSTKPRLLNQFWPTVFEESVVALVFPDSTQDSLTAWWVIRIRAELLLFTMIL